MKHWKPVSITAAAAVLAATLGAGLTASAATPDRAVRASRTTLTVSVTGLQTVAIAESCTWEAHVSGGTAPYTYQWNTMYTRYSASPDPTLTTSFSNVGSDLVYVYVQDAYGNGGSAGLGVFVAPNNTYC